MWKHKTPGIPDEEFERTESVKQMENRLSSRAFYRTDFRTKFRTFVLPNGKPNGFFIIGKEFIDREEILVNSLSACKCETQYKYHPDLCNSSWSRWWNCLWRGLPGNGHTQRGLATNRMLR